MKADIVYWGDNTKARGFHYVYALAKLMPEYKFKIILRNIYPEFKKELLNMVAMENVFFISSTSPKKIREEIQDSKIVLLPFRWMAVRPPLSIVESMALGKCVITSLMQGNEELIRNWENGILVDFTELYPIKCYIDILLEKDDVRNKIGKAARKTIKELYNEKQYERILECLMK